MATPLPDQRFHWRGFVVYVSSHFKGDYSDDGFFYKATLNCCRYVYGILRETDEYDHPDWAIAEILAVDLTGEFADALLSEATTVDGIPWEIHMIEDPVARVAAHEAYLQETR